MIPPVDPQVIWLLGGILGFLSVATAVGAVLVPTATTDSSRVTVKNLNARIRAWWVMCGLFALGVIIGSPGPVVLFGLVSFLALREFITLTPTRRGDHR